MARSPYPASAPPAPPAPPPSVCRRGLSQAGEGGELLLRAAEQAAAAARTDGKVQWTVQHLGRQETATLRIEPGGARVEVGLPGEKPRIAGGELRRVEYAGRPGCVCGALAFPELPARKGERRAHIVPLPGHGTDGAPPADVQRQAAEVVGAVGALVDDAAKRLGADPPGLLRQWRLTALLHTDLLPEVPPADEEATRVKETLGRVLAVTGGGQPAFIQMARLHDASTAWVQARRDDAASSIEWTCKACGKTNERGNLLCKGCEKGRPTDDPTVIFRWMFRFFDKDDNRTLDVREFIMLLGQVIPGASEEQARQMFDRVDTDGNRKISEDEFLHIMTGQNVVPATRDTTSGERKLDQHFYQWDLHQEYVDKCGNCLCNAVARSLWGAKCNPQLGLLFRRAAAVELFKYRPQYVGRWLCPSCGTEVGLLAAACKCGAARPRDVSDRAWVEDVSFWTQDGVDDVIQNLTQCREWGHANTVWAEHYAMQAIANMLAIDLHVISPDRHLVIREHKHGNSKRNAYIVFVDSSHYNALGYGKAKEGDRPTEASLWSLEPVKDAWSCPVCTFDNGTAASACEMCGHVNAAPTPRSEKRPARVKGLELNVADKYEAPDIKGYYWPVTLLHWNDEDGAFLAQVHDRTKETKYWHCDPSLIRKIGERNHRGTPPRRKDSAPAGGGSPGSDSKTTRTPGDSPVGGGGQGRAEAKSAPSPVGAGSSQGLSTVLSDSHQRLQQTGASSSGGLARDSGPCKATAPLQQTSPRHAPAPQTPMSPYGATPTGPPAPIGDGAQRRPSQPGARPSQQSLPASPQQKPAQQHRQPQPGDRRTSAQTGGGGTPKAQAPVWIELEKAEYQRPNVYEGKDAAGTWWSLNLLKQVSVDFAEAEVFDNLSDISRPASLWPQVHRGNLRRSSDQPFRLGVFALYEAECQPGVWRDCVLCSHITQDDRYCVIVHGKPLELKPSQLRRAVVPQKLTS